MGGVRAVMKKANEWSEHVTCRSENEEANKHFLCFTLECLQNSIKR